MHRCYCSIYFSRLYSILITRSFFFSVALSICLCRSLVDRLPVFFSFFQSMIIHSLVSRYADLSLECVHGAQWTLYKYWIWKLRKYHAVFPYFPFSSFSCSERPNPKSDSVLTCKPFTYIVYSQFYFWNGFFERCSSPFTAEPKNQPMHVHIPCVAWKQATNTHENCWCCFTIIFNTIWKLLTYTTFDA